jgi:hypothetical protein
MNALTNGAADEAAIRRRAADEAYRLLAFASAAIWTLGTFLYFILVAAPAPRPVFPAMQGMLGSLVLAAIPWLFRRPLTEHLVARRLREHAAGPRA